MLHFAVKRDSCEECIFESNMVDAEGCVCFDQTEPDEVCLSLAADGGDPAESSAAGFQVDVKEGVYCDHPPLDEVADDQKNFYFFSILRSRWKKTGFLKSWMK